MFPLFSRRDVRRPLRTRDEAPRYTDNVAALEQLFHERADPWDFCLDPYESQHASHTWARSYSACPSGRSSASSMLQAPTTHGGMVVLSRPLWQLSRWRQRRREVTTNMSQAREAVHLRIAPPETRASTIGGKK